MATCLLKADIVQLLNFVPEGTRLPCNLERCPDRQHPKTLIKTKEEFVSARTGKPYPFKHVVRDVENKVLSLGLVIEKAELNPNFTLSFDKENNKIFAYDGYMEEIQKQPDVYLKSDAMYVFKAYMPKQLVDQGMTDAPIKISGFVYDKVRATCENFYRNAHRYNQDDLLAVRDALDEPVAIIKRPAPDGGVRLAVITKIPDFKDDLSMVILQSDEITQDSYICSIYGKDDLINYIKRAQEDGTLLYLGDAEILRREAISPELDEKLDEIILRYYTDKQQKQHQKSVDDNKPQKKRGGQRL